MLNAAAASWLELSGARTGRPSSPLVELQVKVGRASWLSVVGSAHQGATSRQMLTSGERDRSGPHIYYFLIYALAYNYKHTSNLL